jgi:branched-subunit amino acid ABC-type transport system permease component
VFGYATALVTTVGVLLLLSLGLAVVFGMRGIINLAHGEFVMLGAYTALELTRQGVPFGLTIACAAVLVGLFGMVVERLLIRRLYDRLIDCMLATWGLSLIMVQVVTLIFGTTTTGLSIPLGSVTVGGDTVAAYNLVIVGAAIAALVATIVVLTRTRLGLLARATARSRTMAGSLGVDTSRMDMLTFALGSALAGFAGAVLAPFLGIAPGMGQGFIANTFMTVIIGGGTFLVGVPVASGLLGGVENVLSTSVSPVLGQIGLLLVAILIVRLRPQGLTREIRGT